MVLKIDLQLFGGRGSKSSGGGGSGGNINEDDIVSTTSLISAREQNPQSVDETLEVFKDINEEYGYIINDIQLVKLKGKSKSTIAYYSDSNIAVNEKYFDSKTLNEAYANCVAEGFHPSNGNKTALQAVVSHELGHALTEKIADKMGYKYAGKVTIAASNILEKAVKHTKHNNSSVMIGKISGYAAHSAVEAIAEAFADVYCNANKAKSESKAIVNVMNGYLK